MHQTQPDHYSGTLSEDASKHRERLENLLEGLYADLRKAKGVERLKLADRIERIEFGLSLQGANPKEIDIYELSEHIRAPQLDDDPVTKKYRSKIKNRATGIRAYCVQCQGGEIAEVRRCPSVTCPLHPFRMGKDPLRGWEIPKPENEPEIPIEEDDIDETLFEDDDDEDTADAD